MLDNEQEKAKAAGPSKGWGEKWRKPLFAGLAVLAIGGLSLAAVTLTAKRGDAPPMGQEDGRPQRSAVSALGRITPASETIRLASVDNNRLHELLVDRGYTVTKGQVLGFLATYPLRVAERDGLQARLTEARAQLVAEIALGEAEVQAAELTLREAEEAGPLDVAAQQAEVSALEHKLANSRDILKSLGELRRNAVSSRRTHDDQSSLVAQNEALLRAARAQLNAMVLRNRLNVEQAKADLARAKAELARVRSVIPVASLEQEVQAAQAKADLATLIAPIGGRVLNVLARPGDDVTGRPILSLGDTSRMRVVAEVYETDIYAVRLGQHATIASPALPKLLTGKVVEIGHLIYKNDVLSVDPAARTDARVIEVRVDLDDSAAVADMTNLTVDVVIDTEPPDSGAQ